MNLEEAIKTALEYEVQVRDVYADSLKALKNEVGKHMFQTLVKDEQKHVDYLKLKLNELKESGKVNPELLETLIPSKDVILKEIGKLKSHMDKEDRNDELEMLKKALNAEIEASAFYSKMVDTLDEEGQKFFSRFVEIEDGHVAIVQSQIDYITGNGFWFDIREFSLESAY